VEEAADFSPFVLKSKDSVLVGRLSSPLYWSDVVSANIGKVGDDNFDSPSMIFGYDVIEPKSKP